MAKRDPQPVAAETLASLADLHEDPENPREMPKAKGDRLDYSLTEFGDISGIVFNLRTGQLVTGHQRKDKLEKRYGAMPILTEKDAAGKVVRAWIEAPGGKVFGIRLVDWDLKKQRAANLAANNPHLTGEFVKDLLDKHLEEVQSADVVLFDGLGLDQLGPHQEGETAEGEEVELKSFRKTHVLLSFPPDRMIEIQEYLDKITAMDGVEMEIGSN